MATLVIGASGLLGRRLCELLVRQSHDVIATSRKMPVGGPLPGTIWRIVQLAGFERWDRLLRDVDTVYHLAWSTIPSSADLDPAGDLADNVIGTVRLLEAARKRPGIRIVFASSGGTIYGRTDNLPISERAPTNPVSAYGVSKLVVERYIENFRSEYGLDGVALRFGNCYGSLQRSGRGLGAITHFARAALKREAVTIFGSNQIVRDYIHVNDAVDALLAAGRILNLPGPINIGSGVGHSLAEVIEVLERQVGRQIQIHYAAPRHFDVPASVLDIQRAKKELLWWPRLSFEQGIRSVVGELHAQMHAARLQGGPNEMPKAAPTAPVRSSGEAPRTKLRLLSS